jgi:hypothetical protein
MTEEDEPEKELIGKEGKKKLETENGKLISNLLQELE